MLQLNRGKFLLVFAFLISSLGIDAQDQLQAMFNTKKFMLNGKSDYIETYLMIRGNSVKLERVSSGKFQGSVEVLLSLVKDDKPVYTDRYNLLSPETEDSLGRSFNFIDQQRIPIEKGIYRIDISIRDIIAGTPAVQASDSIRISDKTGIAFSDIQLIDAYSKSDKPGKLTKGGYDLVPRLMDYYGPGEDKLIVYAELYNTLAAIGTNQRFLIKYWLEDQSNGTILSNYSGFRKYTPSDVAVLMHEFNIDRLPGGNYRLVLEARDQQNELIAKAEQSVFRSNPSLTLSLEDVAKADITGSFTENYLNKDSLAEFIYSLYPISSVQERSFANNLLTVLDLKMMQQFFLTFWQNRNYADPASAWEKYKLEVIKVNRQFGTSIRKGYDTDRGRVYLQHGSPDNRTVSAFEPSAYPYEIWQYYRLGRQTNRRFVFYNPDLVTNDYQLIHSDALGEIMNDQWHLLLMKRDTQTNDIDATSPNQHFGTQIQQNFQAPR
jgi:GWxTD domain-containing protein